MIPSKNPTIVTIDPGEKHVGLSLWRGRDYVCAYEKRPNEIKDFLKRTDPLIVIVEAFQLQPDKAKALSHKPMRTSELIGEIKSVAQDIGATVIEQQPANKDVAEKSPWARQHREVYGKPQSRHAWDAVLHGIYYWFFVIAPKEKKALREKEIAKRKEQAKRDRAAKRAKGSGKRGQKARPASSKGNPEGTTEKPRSTRRYRPNSPGDVDAKGRPVRPVRGSKPKSNKKPKGEQ